MVLVDYLTAENVANTCSGEISHARVGEYVAAALELARTLPQTGEDRQWVGDSDALHFVFSDSLGELGSAGVDITGLMRVHVGPTPSPRARETCSSTSPMRGASA